MKSNSSDGSGRSVHSLALLGWSKFFQENYDLLKEIKGKIARVTGVRKNMLLVSDGSSEWLTTIGGTFFHGVVERFPAIGDWVLVKDSVITYVLPRKNALSRGASGSQDAMGNACKEQLIATNLETVFVVCGLDHDFNPRRIERYITLAYNCGINPVVVLTKGDLHDEPEQFVVEVESLVFGVPVLLLSKEDPTGLTQLTEYLYKGESVALIGSSGAGKSTLINRLAGENLQQTGEISKSVGKGKHTTTSRDLLVLPCGSIVIDNPGIREIAFWGNGGGLDTAFSDIESLAQLCRFADCTHMNEPACAVRKAVEKGELEEARLVSYQKMRRELEYLEERQHKSSERIEKERWKDVALKIKAMKKKRPHG
ncbi:ribosome small subunit-dependent GTPase A [Halodesulfovibrio marinisediminis]|uniref:Small ribosomal subunit biogenesis GTPase RsgA n=1 Tax=Halodesulfovibrio marinisediminis DSM 17456 TaxID=1121457 RepID=A0A1N6FLV4_9BACT|nr:ribosome small subunit-dependent GTPase A [Halodesulfovibrio marinisediminis]SIN96235.1 ribosome biogenesis GTPase [Halodesulfovibrio marinisediminis DSM 17456]